MIATWRSPFDCLQAEIEGAIRLMEYIEKLLDKVKEWARKLAEALLGPDVQPEPELIPIPVRDPKRRR